MKDKVSLKVGDEVVVQVNTNLVNILTPNQAEKLADLYLPTHLRDFFLGMSPVLQCHFYILAQDETHFFTLILTEWSRFDNEFARQKAKKKQQGFDYTIVPIQQAISYVHKVKEIDYDDGNTSFN